MIQIIAGNKGKEKLNIFLIWRIQPLKNPQVQLCIWTKVPSICMS